MDKPKKRGKLDRTESGQPILINPTGKCYTVTKPIANVWTKLDGTKTVPEIVSELPESSLINPIALETAIDKVITQLKEYELVE